MAEPWRVEADRFVGYYDIMGFRRLVARGSLTHAYDVAQTFRRAAADAQRMTRDIEEGGPTVSARHRRELLRFIQFSDSIFMFTRDAGDGSSLAITLASMKLFLAALSSGFLIRGAWARGTCVLDWGHSIFLGKAVADAYELAEAQRWFGVVEHESIQREDSSRHLKRLGEDQMPLTEHYRVPMKNGSRRLGAVTWPIFIGSLKQIEEVLVHAAGRRSSVPQHLSATLTFARHVHGKYRGRFRGRRE